MEEKEKLNKMISSIWRLLANVGNDIKRVRILLKRIEDGSYETDNIKEEELKSMSSKLLNYTSWKWEVVEWTYDGLYMIGSDSKKYPVPLNYSSKSKLMSWDILKLTILSNGKLMYKLIAPAPRTYIKATLSQSDNDYVAIWDNWKTYKLNPAAVTYFNLNIGEQISIIINAEWKGNYAAIEAKL